MNSYVKLRKFAGPFLVAAMLSVPLLSGTGSLPAFACWSDANAGSSVCPALSQSDVAGESGSAYQAVVPGALPAAGGGWLAQAV